MKMENAEEIFHFLEEFSKRKPKTIPQELNDYLAYVARTGDPVYQWALVKSLFKEKLLNVITDFYETSPGIDIPPYPNVDPFNYDTMKNSLLERLDSFTSAPFTVQRICELLTYPRKQYNRVDKFMRAIEKNILVVSTREPGMQRHIEPENGEPMEPIVNGSDNNSDYNVDVEMEDMSWKENSEPQHSSEPQPSSSETHISVDDIEARLKAKQDAPMDTQDKITTQYESVTPPELNITTDEQMTESKPEPEQQPTTSVTEEAKPEIIKTSNEKPKMDVEMSIEDNTEKQTLVIPEIKVDDAEMTEQRLSEQNQSEKMEKIEETLAKDVVTDQKSNSDDQHSNIDESSSDSNSKDEPDNKHVTEMPTSSEESSSSSDNTDGNSNSPKPVENPNDTPEESSQSDSNMTEEEEKEEKQSDKEKTPEPSEDVPTPVIIENDNYSISDVKSELPPTTNESETKEPTLEVSEESEPIEEKKEKVVSDTTESTEIATENPTT